LARPAITSLAFMWVEVPEPVWKTPRTNWSSKRPASTSAAASAIAREISGASSPSSPFTTAAARLMRATARTRSRGMRGPPIGRFAAARAVCAP